MKFLQRVYYENIESKEYVEKRNVEISRKDFLKIRQLMKEKQHNELIGFVFNLVEKGGKDGYIRN